MYEGYVDLPYSLHLTNNSSSAIKNITNEVANMTGVIIQALQVATILFLGISCLLLYYQPFGAIGVGLMIGIPVLFSMGFLRRILLWGKQREFNEGNRVKIIRKNRWNQRHQSLGKKCRSIFLIQYKQTRADQLKFYIGFLSNGSNILQ